MGNFQFLVTLFQLLNICFALKTKGPSPVQALECNFVSMNFDKISCTWKEPEHPNGLIQYYYVSLLREETTIYGFQTSKMSADINIKLEERGSYLVGVNAMTHIWSRAATTYVKRPKYGRS